MAICISGGILNERDFCNELVFGRQRGARSECWRMAAFERWLDLLFRQII